MPPGACLLKSRQCSCCRDGDIFHMRPGPDLGDDGWGENREYSSEDRLELRIN